MDKNRKNKVLIFALISILLCGVPGCFFMMPGFVRLIRSLDIIQSTTDLFISLAVSGGLICLGGLLLLVPIVLLIIALSKKNKKGAVKELIPTGLSKDDPIPPPS